MEQTLTTAALTNGYAPTYRGTWLRFLDRRNMTIVVDRDPRLFNQYTVMPFRSERARQDAFLTIAIA
jgi:tungstate transport system substrate-binding protein